MKVKIIINGKEVDEIELTDGQINTLELKGDKNLDEIRCLGVKKKLRPFEENFYENYYYINSFGECDTAIAGIDNAEDNELYLVANKCNDKDLMTQRAKEEVLNRLLWRFSIENGCPNPNDFCTIWDTEDVIFFYVEYDYFADDYVVLSTNFRKGICRAYFTSMEIAQRAIDEIIIPFEKGELEVCKIWSEGNK